MEEAKTRVSFNPCVFDSSLRMLNFLGNFLQGVKKGYPNLISIFHGIFVLTDISDAFIHAHRSIYPFSPRTSDPVFERGRKYYPEGTQLNFCFWCHLYAPHYQCWCWPMHRVRGYDLTLKKKMEILKICCFFFKDNFQNPSFQSSLNYWASQIKWCPQRD